MNLENSNLENLEKDVWYRDQGEPSWGDDLYDQDVADYREETRERWN